jgi:26S proteasome regulatory subunit T6
MYALRERRQHVTQEDFEFAVAKVGVSSIDYWNGLTVFDVQVLKKNQEGNTSVNKLFS